MGCCQSSTVSNSDQVDLGPPKDLTNPEAIISEIHNLKFEDLNTSPDIAFYTLGPKLYSNSSVSRYSCKSSQSGQQKEAVLINKSSLSAKDCEKLIENSIKISFLSYENVAKILFVGEDKDCIKVIIEPCGMNSLENAIKNNKFSFANVLNIMKQLMQGVMQYHKLGIILKHLSEKDAFLVNNVVKISISAAVSKTSGFTSPDLEASLKNDVWSLGVIFLKLLFSPSDISSVQEGINQLENLSLFEEDKENIKSFFKPLVQRPSLPEVIQFKWKNDTAKNSKGFAFEKISEEISELLSCEENQSARIEKSEGSSNEFYQSEDIEFYGEFNDDLQEVDVNHEKIRICEILHNEMKEITESLPEHEVSSLDSQCLIRSLPEPDLLAASQDSYTVFPDFRTGSDEASDFDTKLYLSEKASSDSQNSDGLKKLKSFNGFRLTGFIKAFDYKKKLGVVVCNENKEEFLLTLDEIISSKLNVGQILKDLVNGVEVQIKFSVMPDSRKLLDLSYL